MAHQILAGAEALSEFQGFTGDCGQDAELSALHCLPGFSIPLDAAHLNAIVNRDIAAGLTTAPNGAEPITSIARDLDKLGVHYELTPYAEPFTADWHDTLKSFAGVKPVILEYALAGQLPGDESGVHYHFNCVLGLDSSLGYFTADGDNIAARQGQCVWYSFGELSAAQPCAMLVLEPVTPPPPPPPPPGPPPATHLPGADWKDDGTTLTGPNGAPVRYGFREYVLAEAAAGRWADADVPQGPEVAANPVNPLDTASGEGSIQIFAHTVLIWRPNNPIQVLSAGELAAYYRDTALPNAQALGGANVANVRSTLSTMGQQLAALAGEVSALANSLPQAAS